MNILKTRITINLLILALSGNLIASAPDAEWYGDDTYMIGSGQEWFVINDLRTHDNVKVIMPGGGGVNEFWMYDNSELVNYGGSINYLYLYDNTMATFFSSSGSMDIYIDPASTAQVNIYAYDVTFRPLGPYGEGTLHGYWLANQWPFSIDLVGNGAYSKVQIIPEPATVALFCLGVLPLLRRRR